MTISAAFPFSLGFGVLEDFLASIVPGPPKYVK